MELSKATLAFLIDLDFSSSEAESSAFLFLLLSLFLERGDFWIVISIGREVCLETLPFDRIRERDR